MHQGRRLQGLAWQFVGHLVRGKSAQFLVNQREQFIRSPPIAVLNGFEDARDIAHGWGTMLSSFAHYSKDNWTPYPGWTGWNSGLPYRSQVRCICDLTVLTAVHVGTLTPLTPL